MELDSGEERNELAPDTFPIPSRDARENLEVGDEVKLVFRDMTDPEHVIDIDCTDYEPIIGVRKQWRISALRRRFAQHCTRLQSLGEKLPRVGE